MNSPLRVALFCDSFHEANGVGTLSRQFVAFAERHEQPFLCVHSGAVTKTNRSGCLTTIELKRGLAAFSLDHDLYCDPLLLRYRKKVMDEIRLFQPDLIHITGPGDIGVLGFYVSHYMRIPLVASWHTNLHEYAARRLDKLFRWTPRRWRKRVADTTENQSLRACVAFYRLARFLLAPNSEMVSMLEARTRKPAFLMAHGVDPDVYAPCNRKRVSNSFCIGYVGRLTPEKNVRLLVDLEKSLRAAGQRDFHFVVVGEGNEKEWLRKNLESAEFPGVLRGAELAEAFANMDLFVFPSETDTFGLVLLEAMASGVPVVVSPETGARVGVLNGITGYHASRLSEFTDAVLRSMTQETVRAEMRCAAREFALTKAWCGVFEDLYRTYETGLEAIADRCLVASQRPMTS